MADENIFVLYAFCMGIFITFVYDTLRIFRRVIPHNIFWVSLEDIIFWCFCAIEVFLLMYHVSNGTLRWFAVLGAMVGMGLYLKTLSRFLVKYMSLVLRKVRAVMKKVFSFFFKPFRLLMGCVSKTVGRTAGRGKRFATFLKKRLTAFGKVLKMVVCKQ